MVQVEHGWGLNGTTHPEVNTMVLRTEGVISRVGELVDGSIRHFSEGIDRIPGTGSFIRPSSNVKCGVSFLEGLASKYIEAFHGSATQEKVTLGSSNGAIEVEAVNLDKIRGKFSDLTRLKEVSLENELIARANPPGDIQKICPSSVLDLIRVKTQAF